MTRHTDTNFIEVKMISGLTYRYYGYAHIAGAKCLGEGDWRIAEGDKERRTSGTLVPHQVLRDVSRQCQQQDEEHAQ